MAMTRAHKCLFPENVVKSLVSGKNVPNLLKPRIPEVRGIHRSAEAIQRNGKETKEQKPVLTALRSSLVSPGCS